MRARQASLSLLTVAPASRIAMHKHPVAEILYVLKGHARMLAPPARRPRSWTRGWRSSSPVDAARHREHGPPVARRAARLLRAHGPGERLPRPQGSRGARGFEVLHDPKVGQAARRRRKFVVVAPAPKDALPIAGRQGEGAQLLTSAHTGNTRRLPRHAGGRARGGDPAPRAPGRRRRSSTSRRAPASSPSAARNFRSRRPTGDPHPGETAARRQVHRRPTRRADQIYAPAGPEDSRPVDKDRSKARRQDKP